MLAVFLIAILTQTPADAPDAGAPKPVKNNKPHKKTPEEIAAERAEQIARAQKLFESMESKHADFMTHRFPDNKHLRKDALRREEGPLYTMDAAYMAVVKVNAPALSVVSLVRDGTAYWHLDQMVQEVPPPPEVKKLGPDGLKAYSDVFALNGSRKFRDRAQQLWRMADKIAKANGIQSEALDSVRDKMK
jgi:hypothetical protein